MEYHLSLNLTINHVHLNQITLLIMIKTPSELVTEVFIRKEETVGVMVTVTDGNSVINFNNKGCFPCLTHVSFSFSI